MSTKRVRVHFLVHGTVQGVFFRKFTVECATRRKLTGYVWNLPNGKVEGEAQGDEAAVDEFVKDLDRGPPAARVVRVDTRMEEEVVGEEAFEKRKYSERS